MGNRSALGLVFTPARTSGWASQSPLPICARWGLQAGGELGHDVRRRLWRSRERDALPGPHRERFDVPGAPDHRRGWLIPNDSFAGGEVRDHVAPSWALVVWGAACGLPRPGRRVAQGAV